MTEIKELDFTPENLERHMKIIQKMASTRQWAGRVIVTTRRSKKGEVGDVFFIKGIGHAVLMTCNRTRLNDIRYGNTHLNEGFTSGQELASELEDLYNEGRPMPAASVFYIHELMLLNNMPEEEISPETAIVDSPDMEKIASILSGLGEKIDAAIGDGRCLNKIKCFRCRNFRENMSRSFDGAWIWHANHCTEGHQTLYIHCPDYAPYSEGEDGRN